MQATVKEKKAVRCLTITQKVQQQLQPQFTESLKNEAGECKYSVLTNEQ